MSLGEGGRPRSTDVLDVLIVPQRFRHRRTRSAEGRGVESSTEGDGRTGALEGGWLIIEGLRDHTGSRGWLVNNSRSLFCACCRRGCHICRMVRD